MLVCDDCKEIGKEVLSYTLKIYCLDPMDHDVMAESNEVINRGMHLCEDCAIERKWLSRNSERIVEAPTL